jgi:hypothetical protein
MDIDGEKVWTDRRNNLERFHEQIRSRRRRIQKALAGIEQAGWTEPKRREIDEIVEIEIAGSLSSMVDHFALCFALRQYRIPAGIQHMIVLMGVKLQCA